MTIEIEPLLFNDFHVGVYDENLSLVLDKKYYCKGQHSATFTAVALLREYPEAIIKDNNNEQTKFKIWRE
jgi:hypothetical protein